MPATFSQLNGTNARLCFSNVPLAPPQDLTTREKQILQLIWDRLTSREIEHRLTISVKTAEAHRATIMKKVRASHTA
jgi:FixJ family two-component response regulator